VKQLNILLVDVDSKEGNLALAKILTYYKKQGHSVEYRRLGLDGYPSKKHIAVKADAYDKVFVSILFEINQCKVKVTDCCDVTVGGMGSANPELQLAPEIYNEEAEQSIFTDGVIREYLTRGCIRKCYFCKVWKYEGGIRHNKSVSDIVKDDKKKYKFMDNNILAYPGHLAILKELVDRKVRLQFNQGLDIRLLNNKNAELLSMMNYMGEYIFAFDNIEDEVFINRGLRLFKNYVKKDWKCKFYIYHNEEYGDIADLIYRVEWCRKNRVLPYVMRDKNCWDSPNRDFLIDYAAYCNQPSLFKKLTFEDFLSKRHKDIGRIDESIRTYQEKRNFFYKISVLL
jgi:hypothetical protein